MSITTTQPDRIADSATRAAPLRVAFVLPSFDVGGQERCVARLANDLSRARIQPVIVSLTESGEAAEWIKAGDVRICELHKGRGNDLGMVRRLAHVLKEQQIDVVHSHSWGTLIETVCARRLAGIASHVHSERGTVLGRVGNQGLRMKLRGWVAGWGLRRTDAVITNAHSVAARVAGRCGYPLGAIRIIPNGVDAPPIDSPLRARGDVRQQLGIEANAFVMGSVGRLVPVKGFDLAVAALAELVHQGHDAHLLLVGDGSERSQLAALAQTQGVSGHVHLVGNQTEIGRWLAAMDVFVNTSHSEGMSQSLVEAMSLGLPLVVTDVGDNRNLVEDDLQCGLVLPRRSTEAAREAVTNLLVDRQLRTTLGRNARQAYLRSFQLETMIAAYEKLYCQLAETKRARRGRAAKR